MRRLALVLLAAMLIPVATADARLRDPRLSSNCANGFQYGESKIGPWRVEGCSKAETLREGESVRRVFKGVVEVNGMLVKGGNDLIATSKNTGESRSVTNASFEHRIKRTGDARLVLDPKIGGQRREFVIFAGSVDLTVRTIEDSGLVADDFDLTPAGNESQPRGTVDIPVGIGNSVLGLRLRDEIEDADVYAGSGNGNDPATLEFGVRMSLGSTASALLKDATARVKIKTVDGTGMQVSNLKFAVPDIVLPGIGGFRDLEIFYSEPRDEWGGGVELDLGELFPTFDFAMTVNASTGAPTSMEAEVSPLNMPIGNSGIFLQSVRASFNTNPLVMGAGATATAGPQVAGVALIEMSGDVEMRLEPNFRLEAEGNTRVLTAGPTAQLATGDMSFILDSTGYLSLGGGAEYKVLVIDVGIGARIEGRGEYATDRNRFNIQAEATGTLYLGFLGQVDVVKYAAVVSSEGWGTCGNVALFIKAGVGQHWDGNVKLLLGCDLTQFKAPINSTNNRLRAAGANQRTFTVAPGTKMTAVKLRATGPDPDFTITGPGGVSVSSKGGTRTIANRVSIVAPPGSKEHAFFLKNPRAGTYTVSWFAPELDSDSSAMVVARDAPPVTGKVSVERQPGKPGRRRLRVTGLTGIEANEQVMIGVRTPNGVVPLGDVTRAGGALDATFDEKLAGNHQIVATVVREGIPMPGRTRVIGRYRATLPPPPATVLSRRGRTNVLTMLARSRKGAEPPDAWVYVVRSSRGIIGVARARPGRTARLADVPSRGRLSVTVRGVLKGRVLPGPAKTVRVR